MNASALAIMTAMTLATLGSSCKQEVKGPINRNLPTTTMRLGNEQFTLEIADEDKEREVGLMNRRSMPSNHGMIFVFPEESRLSFYMKSTLIPLDIVYLDGDGDIISIHAMQPLDLTSIPSRAPAKYAIELNLGTAARLGLKPGDRLEIPKAAAHADR